MAIENLLDFRDIEKCPRLVIKIGSALLVHSDGQPRFEWLRTVAHEVAGARERGQEVIVVASGSFGAPQRLAFVIKQSFG